MSSVGSQSPSVASEAALENAATPEHDGAAPASPDPEEADADDPSMDGLFDEQTGSGPPSPGDASAEPSRATGLAAMPRIPKRATAAARK
ncbi:hypothetical protein IWQ57_006115, partial [Coemansia nantahalensis]